MNCDDCPNYINRGPTMVPYQEGWVSAGDDWECADPDCLDDGHNTVRYWHLCSEEQEEAGDYYGDMDREGGRWRS